MKTLYFILFVALMLIGACEPQTPLAMAYWTGTCVTLLVALHCLKDEVLKTDKDHDHANHDC